MFTSKQWIAATRLGLEAQHVIALRLAKIGAGGAAAATESHRMVAEKVAAAAAAQHAAASALARGKSLEDATTLAMAPIARTVRANRRRLSHANQLEALVRPLRRLAKRARRPFGK